MCLHGVSDAGAVLWACVMVSLSVPAGVLIQGHWLCSDAGAVVWACEHACMGC